MPMLRTLSPRKHSLESSSAATRRPTAQVVDKAAEATITPKTLLKRPRAPVVVQERPFPRDNAAADERTLWQIDLRQENLTIEQLYEIDAILHTLLLQDEAAVAEIWAFLAEGGDLNFVDPGFEGNPINYSSLRLALIQTLRQIGGEAAEIALIEELLTVTKPLELAAIASAL